MKQNACNLSEISASGQKVLRLLQYETNLRFLAPKANTESRVDLVNRLPGPEKFVPDLGSHTELHAVLDSPAMSLLRVIRRTLRLLVTNTRPNKIMLSASLTQVSVVLLMLVLLSAPRVQGFGVCRSSFRCLNGGRERYGQSIFGPCRCMCPYGYTGPRCQYREVTRKRSSSLNVLNDFLQARLRAERRQQEEAITSYDYNDLQPMQRRRRSRRRSHPRFFRR